MSPEDVLPREKAEETLRGSNFALTRGGQRAPPAPSSRLPSLPPPRSFLAEDPRPHSDAPAPPWRSAPGGQEHRTGQLCEKGAPRPGCPEGGEAARALSVFVSQMPEPHGWLRRRGCRGAVAPAFALKCSSPRTWLARVFAWMGGRSAGRDLSSGVLPRPCLALPLLCPPCPSQGPEQSGPLNWSKEPVCAPSLCPILATANSESDPEQEVWSGPSHSSIFDGPSACGQQPLRATCRQFS